MCACANWSATSSMSTGVRLPFNRRLRVTRRASVPVKTRVGYIGRFSPARTRRTTPKHRAVPARIANLRPSEDSPLSFDNLVCAPVYKNAHVICAGKFLLAGQIEGQENDCSSRLLFLFFGLPAPCVCLTASAKSCGLPRFIDDARSFGAPVHTFFGGGRDSP